VKTNKINGMNSEVEYQTMKYILKKCGIKKICIQFFLCLLKKNR
jgi:hypothetical protein